MVESILTLIDPKKIVVTVSTQIRDRDILRSGMCLVDILDADHVSDSTRITYTNWAELKSQAIRDDYTTNGWYGKLGEREREMIEHMRE